jgi:hypothetical protein
MQKHAQGPLNATFNSIQASFGHMCKACTMQHATSFKRQSVAHKVTWICNEPHGGGSQGPSLTPAPAVALSLKLKLSPTSADRVHSTVHWLGFAEDTSCVMSSSSAGTHAHTHTHTHMYTHARTHAPSNLRGASGRHDFSSSEKKHAH